MEFRAPEAIKKMFSSEKELDKNGKQVSWLDQMKRIKAGTEIFEVWAHTAPPQLDDAKLVQIAKITLTSDLITSIFADARMFFSHLDKDWDHPFYPEEWLGPDNSGDKPKCNRGKKNKWLWGAPDPNDPKDKPWAWPQTAEEAKIKFADESEQWGCPFKWLIEWSKSGVTEEKAEQQAKKNLGVKAQNYVKKSKEFATNAEKAAKDAAESAKKAKEAAEKKDDAKEKEAAMKAVANAEKAAQEALKSVNVTETAV